jgi:hypothetical protein
MLHKLNKEEKHAPRGDNFEEFVLLNPNAFATRNQREVRRLIGHHLCLGSSNNTNGHLIASRRSQNLMNSPTPTNSIPATRQLLSW